jgi:hypothetical protein
MTNRWLVLLMISGCGSGTMRSLAQSSGTTRISFEASNDHEASWHDAVTARPGDLVVLRMRIQMVDPSPNILGLAGLTTQPTLTNWLPTSGDTATPFTNALGQGVLDEPGNHGRLIPFDGAPMGPGSNPGLPTAFNDPGGTLRFAGANAITPTTNLSWGMNMNQRGGDAFLYSTNVLTFKYAFTLGSNGSSPRTLVASMSASHVQNSRVTWWISQTGANSYLYTLTQNDIIPATITVIPTPAALTVLAIIGVLPIRRRRDQP